MDYCLVHCFCSSLFLFFFSISTIEKLWFSRFDFLFFFFFCERLPSLASVSNILPELVSNTALILKKSRKREVDRLRERERGVGGGEERSVSLANFYATKRSSVGKIRDTDWLSHDWSERADRLASPETRRRHFWERSLRVRGAGNRGKDKRLRVVKSAFVYRDSLSYSQLFIIIVKKKTWSLVLCIGMRVPKCVCVYGYVCVWVYVCEKERLITKRWREDDDKCTW